MRISFVETVLMGWRSWGWEFILNLSSGTGTTLSPVLGLGNNIMCWDGNGIGRSRPKPASLLSLSARNKKTYEYISDDAFFQPELGWSVWRSLGRT